ncbi:hypothetical protein SE18_14905 [Herpetosiphon geysericola]|uniref:Uncharacterized protein n=1 Tax=Herpetosiphon geysericola TaxID=70996 RepID=A0A0P6YLL1_9CHLR|nr:hypothetical protein SE18_14905 [Herpetosiphon geysericola]
MVNARRVTAGSMHHATPADADAQVHHVRVGVELLEQYSAAHNNKTAVLDWIESVDIDRQLVDESQSVGERPVVDDQNKAGRGQPACQDGDQAFVDVSTFQRK